MSQHVFQGVQGHVIVDVSGEPVPHIGRIERIYCPTCEQDVNGKYIGQASGIEDISNTYSVDEIDLIPSEQSNDPYCLRCDGPCEE